MAENNQSIQTLMSLGPKSEQMLNQIGIMTRDQFLAQDPFEVYRKLHEAGINIGLNGMYALISAQNDITWLEVARSQRESIIMHLDDMGLAPR